MSEYWKDHAQKASIQTMMLDSNAEELSKDEVPEIMSYLPDVANKRMVELGAGIGRFTNVLAQKAEHVVAVDFMEEFIEKNKKLNNHMRNIDFKCQDVTKMELPDASVDIVFSNWLFMYLEDDEVQLVYNKMLRWLKEGGHVFIRESCNRQSGNKPRQNNPTNYREDIKYDAMFSAANIPYDETHNYGFDLVFSTAVVTYIKHKNNKDQRVWLLQKVKRDKAENHGFKTFQEFLDSQQYSKNSILRYEKVFGRTFVSTGGLSTTKDFVKLLDLKPGQRVLDVGGGIGGSAFYMVQNYGVKVVSIDLSSNMTSIGYERAEELGIPPDHVVFEIADATKRDYPDNSFDAIYSRDAILHIKEKLELFQRFYKWLKPGGKILISDYCCKEGDHSEEFKAYVKQRGYNLLNPSQYGKVLEKAGLVNVKAEDKTVLFGEILRSELERTLSIKDEFIEEFGEKNYNDIVEGWTDKVKRVGKGDGDQRWGLFYAEKPRH
ncbi:hypothetical protein LOTGIDRAFT_219756 [Lottia gigantea]|uniref:phosphoethanolamine N-methyltransferase n=1 Tax=Lottia gigantea TaxID=225164 RepID=V3ZZ16_LOTGI|nr:hypothetical protein LOTGIDRAFT_219756 [Lottia gigantea]ESO87855.1 hypothetical protein LOTGIDRAFT_219756 [Lottia gigantea]